MKQVLNPGLEGQDKLNRFNQLRFRVRDVAGRVLRYSRRLFEEGETSLGELVKNCETVGSLMDGNKDSVHKELVGAFSEMIGVLSHNARVCLGGIQVQAVQEWLTELDAIVSDADKLAEEL